MSKEEKEKQMVFNAPLVEEITQKINDGYVVKRYQNPWFKGEIGVRRAGITYAMTEDEIQEYIKCKIDIHYFADNYCRIKTEDGTVQQMKLRDYQEEILDLYTKNRFSILMASRQVGKTVSAAITILHFILFNNDKNVMIIANKGDTAIEIVDKVKSIITLLPCFLQKGVKFWNQKSLIFDNGCRIKTSARSKTPAIGFTIDFLYLDEFAHIPANIIEPYYTAAYPTVSAVENSKIVITSTPNGMNMFYKLLTSAERPVGDPLKNNYKAMRVYWFQVPGRYVTYVRLDEHKMYVAGITKEQILDRIKSEFDTKIEMKYSSDLNRNVIHVFNNDNCSTDDIRKLMFEDKTGLNVPIASFTEITTWKDEAIKDIGGEEAFNQEYDLRFINSSKSLFSEKTIDNLLKGKKVYKHVPIDVLDEKLKFHYDSLIWIDDDSVFNVRYAKNTKVIFSVDLAEGLGQDYSVINIFRISEKPIELAKLQMAKYTSHTDFFRLEQIGMYRNNLNSVLQISEILYLLVFEVFNDDNVKVVLEYNTYGSELLAHMPHLFDGNNNYGSNVFFRYKHRMDATEEKIGLKVNDNKSNMLVKDYQDAMERQDIVVSQEDNVREITTFVRNTTAAGNTRYEAETGNDDTVMTVVDMATVFKKTPYKDMVDEYLLTLGDTEFTRLVRDFDKNMDYKEGVDYSTLLKVNKDRRYDDQIKKGLSDGKRVDGWNFGNKRIL